MEGLYTHIYIYIYILLDIDIENTHNCILAGQKKFIKPHKIFVLFETSFQPEKGT